MRIASAKNFYGSCLYCFQVEDERTNATDVYNITFMSFIICSCLSVNGNISKRKSATLAHVVVHCGSYQDIGSISVIEVSLPTFAFDAT